MELWEIILKTVTVLIAFFGFIYQLIGFDPQKRRKLKNDLDILEKLKEHNLHDEYERIKEHVKSRIKYIYRKPKETDTLIRIPDLRRLLLGIFLLPFFTGITVYYYIIDGFQWWMIITTLFLIAGLGNIMQGVSGEYDE